MSWTSRLRGPYQRWVAGMNRLQPVVLLGIRLYWGYQFALTGWGKLANVDRVASYFESLAIPMPTVNVYMAGANRPTTQFTSLLGQRRRRAM